MLVGFEIDHVKDYTTKYVIHKIDDLTIDDNIKDKILTTSYDAEKNYSSKKRMLRYISKYIKTKHIDKRTVRKVRKYFAVWQSASRDYISICYPCQI